MDIIALLKRMFGEPEYPGRGDLPTDVPDSFPFSPDWWMDKNTRWSRSRGQEMPGAPVQPPPLDPGDILDRRAFEGPTVNVEAERYVPRGSERAPEQVVREREDLWADFLAQNPGLDLDAVAQQAGAVTHGVPRSLQPTPGGTLSEPVLTTEGPMAIGPDQTDAAVKEWLATDARRAEADRMLDKKRRGYDPTAGQAILDDLSQQQANAAQMIYSAAQQTRADAEATTAKMQKQLMEYSMSPAGRMGALIDELLATVTAEDVDLLSKLRIAKIELARGNNEPAMMVLQEITDANSSVRAPAVGNDIKRQQLEYAAKDLGP